MRMVARWGLAVGLLVAAGVVAWRTWPRTSAGQFDPVAAVLALAGLAVGAASLIVTIRAQRQDVAAAARQLAAAVKHAETDARKQLLGGHDRPIDVQFIFHAAKAHDAVGAGSEGSLEKIAAYYRKLKPRRMVITGVAGSGKTVLAVELILGLLKDRDPGTPIPVRISAASLDTSRPADSAVMDWLAEHLRQAYKVPEATARELVKWRMVVPVLDGLDEMDAGEPGYSSRAGQVIRACNAYLDGTQKAEMILTCRIGQYQALEKAGEWVHNAARIQLCPVKVDTARSFLTSRVSDMTPWQPVLDQMEQRGSGPLAVALSTPWRLTLAVTAYGQRNPTTGDYPRNPADLATSPQLDTEDAVRDHLLALFIPATLVAHKGPYRDDHVHRWLAVLAGYLDGNTAGPDRPDRKIAGRTLSDTDLVLHELWPLAGSRAARAVTAGALAVLTAVGLAAFLLTRARLGFTGSRVLGAVVIGIAGLALLRYSWTAWPQIQVVDLRSLKTRQSRRDLMYTLARGPGSTIAAGTALVVVYTDEIGFLLAFGITFAFAIGLAMGLAVMLSTDFRHYSVVGTRQIIRTTYVAGIVAGLMMGLVGGLMMGLVAGLVTGLVAGLVAGLAGIRYIAFLLCTRRWSDHWLPWQLGGFLHWCYKAGLIRISGVSYQFRHRELQDYLASNPRPPRILSTPGSEVIPQP